MSKDIAQTLLETRAEHPIDADEWTARLAQFGFLTERQAEVVVRLYGLDQSVSETADGMDVTESRIYNLRSDTLGKLVAADETLREIEYLRQAIRPDPHD